MKVHIEQDSPIPETTNQFVLSPTGDYGPFDLIEFYQDGIKQSFGAYQAQFVKFGGIVYRESEYIELLKQLNVVVEAEPVSLDEILQRDQTIVITDAQPTVQAENSNPTELAPYNVQTPDGSEPVPQPISTDQTVPVLESPSPEAESSPSVDETNPEEPSQPAADSNNESN